MILTILFFILSIGSCQGYVYDIKIDFKTNYYNTSNCSYTPYKQKVLRHNCYDTTRINKFPECCYEVFDRVNIFNTTMNKCVNTQTMDIQPLSINYDCRVIKQKTLNFTEVVTILGVIGLLLISIFTIGLITWLMCNFCCVNNNEYQQL